MKKLFFIIVILFFNYLLLTAVIFTFSYISLSQGKTYDWFWVKSIQKKIYFKGYRNIWQNNSDCTVFDKNLLYKPREGSCIFVNPEFNTVLNFDKYSRIHNPLMPNLEENEHILVLGDSVAMGWGVNDNETFASKLEILTNKKVYNLGVSSYGTKREIKKMFLTPYFKNSDTIIIQYHPNDLDENKNLNYNKVYSKEEFNDVFKKNNQISNFKLILRNYKSSLRLFFSDLNDLLFKEENIEIYDFKENQKYLEKVIKEHISLQEKNLIVIWPIQSWQKVINFSEKNSNIKYKIIELEKSDFFIIDDHPNKKGHSKIANVLYDLIKN